MICATVKAYSGEISCNPEALCCNLQIIPSYLIADPIVSLKYYFSFGIRNRPRFHHVIWLALDLCSSAIYHGKLPYHLQVPLFLLFFSPISLPLLEFIIQPPTLWLSSIRIASARNSLPGLSSFPNSPQRNHPLSLLASHRTALDSIPIPVIFLSFIVNFPITPSALSPVSQLNILVIAIQPVGVFIHIRANSNLKFFGWTAAKTASIVVTCRQNLSKLKLINVSWMRKSKLLPESFQKNMQPTLPFSFITSPLCRSNSSLSKHLCVHSRICWHS